MPLDPSEAELNNMVNNNSPSLNTWLDAVEEAIESLESSYLLEIRERLLNELITEALAMPNLEAKVDALQTVLSPCAEKEALLEHEMNKELENGDSEGGWINARILESVMITDHGGGQQLLGNRHQVSLL